MITASQVRAIAKTLGAAPRADLVDAIVRGWPEAVSQAKVTTRKRAAAFIGQIMTETGGLQILSESGAYREATIMKIFGVGKHSAKVTAAEAKRIAALPVAKRGPVLFNRVYGVGNPTKAKEFKNTGPNDGWLYRGGGMMQCTGKSNYAAMAKRTGLPLVEHPELLHQPDTAFKAAYLEWGQDARANRTADAINGSGQALRDSLAANRRVINGGTNGLKEFIQYYAKALDVLKGYDATAAGIRSRPR
jgi:predicted chitinase